MKRNCLAVAATFFLLLLFALPALAQPRKKEILIGLIPEMNVFAQMERFKPLAEYLSSHTGLNVRLRILSRYGNILESFEAEGMDGAFFGSFTGAMAIRKLGVVPLARPVNLDGESTYHGVLYVRKDSGIRTAVDMQGKKFAFVEKATTAGYIFPLAYLKQNGIRGGERFFSEYYFSGSHDASIYAVLEGKADIGASKNSVYDWVRKTDPRVDRELVVLARSSKVPSNGLCVRKDLDPEIRRKLKEALLRLDKAPEGKEVLKKFRALKFIETTVESYAPVFDLARSAGIVPEKYDYRND